MINTFLRHVVDWAKQDSRILCVLLVGSYARGDYKVDSDIDLVIVSASKSRLLEHASFVDLFGSVRDKQIEHYGNCTSIRVWFDNGPEVEFGLVEPSWLSLPLDSGTKKVLDGGYKILIDKQN